MNYISNMIGVILDYINPYNMYLSRISLDTIKQIVPNDILQNSYKVSEYLIQTKNNIENTLMSSAFVGIYNRFTLMESMLLLDGVICSISFLKDFLILKLSSHKLGKKAYIVYNEEIVDKYNNIYKLSPLDRYLFYLLIYFGYNIINYFHNENRYSYMLILLIVVPGIQNSLLSIKYINNPLNQYIENKGIFIKYSISKLSVHIIQYLHPQIEKIPNYHIFIIYKLLDSQFVWDIIKNCLFISLLNILRSYDSTYYYYKGIKMAYYYNVGYLYNIIPLQDALYTVNIIIRQKRWSELSKIEVTNSFLVLFIEKYELFNKLTVPFFINMQIILYQILSLYSLISVFKIINSEGYLSPIWTSISFISIGFYLGKLNIKNVITSILIYFLILFNINDLIITFVIIIHRIVYYWIEEIYFFIINIQNVKKVIRMYEIPSKDAMMSRIRDEYIVV